MTEPVDPKSDVDKQWRDAANQAELEKYYERQAHYIGVYRASLQKEGIAGDELENLVAMMADKMWEAFFPSK